MAFTGVAAIKQIADNLFRITGLSLASGATGTIGLDTNALAEVQIPAVGWNRYNNALGQQVELDESVQIQIVNAVADPTTTEPVSVVKTGDGPADFLMTLQNNDAAASGALEIYVRFH